ncbi:hypothetical protein F2Q69_00014356 [Brassica cretica]|uniref:Uncharacterized protein n=1 Tax=Brassica cretica TaxID=69181 RepID=A0A8S9QRF5_BRACR|nr:hypothetical protein F2Q69_00014356 [Brassica cretica]
MLFDGPCGGMYSISYNKSPPSSLVSDVAVSVNLWIRFIRIAGSNARDNPSRLVVEEKGKDIADSPIPTRDASATGSPVDDFDSIHRDALRDTENMTLSHRLLVADAHRLIRDEGADRVEVGSSDVSGSESRGGDKSDTAAGFEGGDADAFGRSPTPSRRVHKRVCFDQIDCCPTIYHPGGIFEELLPLPAGLLFDPRAQSWGNVFGSFRHPNTIAYPEKFFESAQAVVAHSHIRWPDLSREWIRRQQARIAIVDWESRLPCVLGPRKLRLPLFTRKQ